MILNLIAFRAMIEQRPHVINQVRVTSAHIPVPRATFSLFKFTLSLAFVLILMPCWLVSTILRDCPVLKFALNLLLLMNHKVFVLLVGSQQEAFKRLLFCSNLNVMCMSPYKHLHNTARLNL